MNQFVPYGVISTSHILPAAALISCGARLHDHKETREDPCIRLATHVGGKQEIITIFQFHSATSKGEKVKYLLECYRALDFGNPCPLPSGHVLRHAHGALKERNKLHALYLTLISGGIEPQACTEKHSTSNTRLAATLIALGFQLKCAKRVSEKRVCYFFDQDISHYSDAFLLPYYIFDQDHPIYHMRGALENREQLIVLLKRASVRVEIVQNGKRFFLPLNATDEKLTHIISKLNQ